MRLTLRTLLAYLDDVLDADNAREIGNRINESSYATMLMSRIREVMRQRRLTAPDLQGPKMGLDPNTVAEYLDSTLPPTEVADVEKVCLESDVHLAEVAASHQVLTIVLGEPVDVLTRTRDRMYALGPRASAGTKLADAPAATSANSAKANDSRDDADSKPVTKAIEGGSADRKSPLAVTPAKPKSDAEIDRTIPEYLRPAPLWRRVAPVAIGLLVIGGWLWLMYGEVKPHSAETTSSSSSSSTEIAANIPESGATSDKPTPDAAKTQPAAIEVAETTEPIEPFVRRPAPMPTVEPVPTKTPTEPEAVALVTPKAEPKPMPPEQPSVEPAPAVKPVPTVTEPALPLPEIFYASRTGLLAQAGTKGWQIMPKRAAVRAGDRLATPVPFSATLEVASLGLVLELLPGTSVEVVGATEKEAVVLKLNRGRLAIKRTAKESETPVTIGLRLYSEPCQLTLRTGKTYCGVEIIPREPTSFEMDLQDDRYQGHVAIVEGEIHFEGALGGDDLLKAPLWASISPHDRKPGNVANVSTPLLVIPDWLDPAKSKMSGTERTHATKFEKEIGGELPLHDSVPSLVTAASSPTLTTFAVRTLAVTDHYAELVRSLGAIEFDETRAAVVSALRQWLPQAPENKLRLQEELRKNFPEEHVDTIYRLLWGYDDSDARNPVTSRKLVELLRSDRLEIRHLAFFHLYRLTGQKYDYHPTKPLAQRNAAVERWESHVDRKKGALID